MPNWFNPPGWLDATALLWVVHLAIALSLMELLVRLVMALRQGRVGAPAGQLLHLCAGLCLMLALREALSLNRPWWVLVWLSAAGAAHLGDSLWQRRP